MVHFLFILIEFLKDMIPKILFNYAQRLILVVSTKKFVKLVPLVYFDQVLKLSVVSQGDFGSDRIAFLRIIFERFQMLLLSNLKLPIECGSLPLKQLLEMLLFLLPVIN